MSKEQTHSRTDSQAHNKAGNWVSAITSSMITGDSISIDEPLVTADAVYYIERRPLESGRCVIVMAKDRNNNDMLPAPYSCRSRVHEYGGGCYCIDGQGVIYFVNDSDQDIYRIEGQRVTRITTAAGQRFADLIYNPHSRQLVAICETHPASDADQNILNTIVSIDIEDGKITALVEGDDFYASPRLSPDAEQLCWQSWNHPNMPWDGNRLWLADIEYDIDTGRLTQLSNTKHIAGAENISTFQPQWSPDSRLFYISDDTGWWQLYRYKPAYNTEDKPEIIRLTTGEKEFGLPQWVFAQSTYAFINDNAIVCTYQSQGKACLAFLSLSKATADGNNLQEIETPWQEFSNIHAHGDHLCFIAASGDSFPHLISSILKSEVIAGEIESSSLSTEIIKSSCQLPLNKDHYSIADSIRFSNRFQQTVYANYYPPCNPDTELNDGELPPLIVICHGGPTGHSSIALDPKKQFWTSRGFALLDVNYSGSTGYGREYRSRLDGNWGKLDVSDCCDAALYAVSQGLADKQKLIIRGSSAGGYTVLSALTFEDVFSAGASYYGISELTRLASDTHKFEARYLDRLIGPYPETEDLYQQRSPINYSEQLNCPVIFFQGIEDRVVPKEQAEEMVTALTRKGVTVAAQYYEGEQHGFRKAETIEQSLENELSFYQLVFKLKPKDEISFEGDIQLENL